MSESHTRRNLLGGLVLGGILGAEALAFGVPVPIGGLWPSSRPLVLPEGMRERMATLNKDGVVFVVPDDAMGRHALGEALQRLLVRAAPGMSMLLRPELPPAMVYVTLHEPIYGVASAEAVGARSGEQLVLLSPSGERLAGGSIDLRSPATMTRSIRSLLDKEPFATHRRARLPSDAVEGMRTWLADPEAKIDGEARDPEPSRLAAALVEDLRRSPVAQQDSGSRPRRSRPVTPQLRDRVQRALSGPLDATREERGEAPVVFGVKWGFDAYDVCPTCGMVSIPAYHRRFVGFVASDE